VPELAKRHRIRPALVGRQHDGTLQDPYRPALGGAAQRSRRRGSRAQPHVEHRTAQLRPPHSPRFLRSTDKEILRPDQPLVDSVVAGPGQVGNRVPGRFRSQRRGRFPASRGESRTTHRPGPSASPCRRGVDRRRRSGRGGGPHPQSAGRARPPGRRLRRPCRRRHDLADDFMFVRVSVGSPLQERAQSLADAVQRLANQRDEESPSGSRCR